MSETVEKRSVERVPISERTTGFLSLFLLWSGFNVAIGSLFMGGIISQAGFWKAFIGFLIAQSLNVYMSLGAFMGASEGLPGTMIMRSGFGIRGRVIPTFPMIIGCVGWFGIQLSITASGVDNIVRDLYGDWGLPIDVQYLIWAFLTGILAVYGYHIVLKFQKFVAPVLIVLLVWMFVKMATTYDLAAEISRPRETSMSIFQVIFLITGGGLALLQAAADSSRYAKSRRAGFFGFFSSSMTIATMVFTMGILGSLIVADWDPPNMVSKLGLGFIGVAIVVLASLCNNVMNPYWGGMAFSTLTTGSKYFPHGIPRVISTIIVVILGAISAVFGIYSLQGLITFIIILGATLGPANGIIIADYFFLRGKGKNKLNTSELEKVGGIYWYKSGFNPVAVSVWIAGVIYTLIFKETYILITPISSQILAGTLYYILMKTAGKKYLGKG